MLVDLNEVLQNDGGEIRLSVMPEMEQFVSKMGAFPIVNAEPVNLCIRNKGDWKIEITGDTVVTAIIPCARCLKDVPVCLELHIEREADMKQTSGERIQALDEQAYIEGHSLDVDQLLSVELLLNWPYRVLCRSDCKGLCSRCGADLNEGSCGCSDEEPDPRMAKILDIFNKLKEV